MNQPKAIDITQVELDALVKRVEDAVEHELSLHHDDMKLLLAVLGTMSMIQNKLEGNELTLLKLRKLLGVVKSSEKRSRTTDSDSDHDEQTSPNKRRSTRSSNTNKPPKIKPKIEHRSLDHYQKGDPCPNAVCFEGHLKKRDPKEFIRVQAYSPYVATKYVCETLVCNLCGFTVSADLPQTALDDGEPRQMYGYSARAMMGIHKCFSGLPYHHQGQLQELLGMRLSTSTIYDQCEALAESLKPMAVALKQQAAQAERFLIDDTRNRILQQQPELRKKRNSKKGDMVERTGVFTSVLIAVDAAQHEIALFETSLAHAGELIDDVLVLRPDNLPIPLLMCDALSSNKPSVDVNYHLSLCNAHARRLFKELETLYPDEISWVLDEYGKIWHHDKQIKNHQWDDQQRLDYHQNHSLPIMQNIKAWCESQQQAEDFEAHSSLAKAIHYFLKHYKGLSLFCSQKGALIDNNRTEETIKLAIRQRKTSQFYQTAHGAEVASIITSVIATAHRAGINAFDYLIALQRHHDQVKQNPLLWLPWCYEETLKTLSTNTSPKWVKSA